MTPISLSLLFALSLPAHAQYVGESIYRGKPVAADGQAWKSVGALSYETSPKSWAACTGTFIADDLILTAAHCKVMNNRTLIVKLFKNNDAEATEQLLLEGKAYEFHPHPRYIKSAAGSPGTNDVAIIVLREQRLPEGFESAPFFHSGIRSLVDPGRTVFSVGAGGNERGKMSDRLFFAQGVISHFLSDNLMHIDHHNGQGVCGGDSGGPVFVKSGNELFLAALITSTYYTYTKECGPIVFSNFINASRYDWIQRKAGDVRARFAKDKAAEEAEQPKP